MKPSTAKSIIASYKNIQSSDISEKDSILIDYIINGINHVVFPDNSNNLIHDMRIKLVDEKDSFRIKCGKAYLQGIDIATNCKVGRKPGKGIKLNHIRVPEAVFKGLEHISKSSNCHLNTIRKRAYKEYIVNHGGFDEHI